ncbi:hypothetical protein [Pseudoduganella chitinolytica]|uniref:Uncharacterized protein n=1 Tax=Pseudoduganella chitinolytica TaxID=34070 RepID=A0ABY8B669_9BURK|nr:hypothetical protein [Pseudoduganella chitinolytica]WEF31370.1 hypothetical protein PX653_18125 [Pseudoduganella chitinolytica]
MNVLACAAATCALLAAGTVAAAAAPLPPAVTTVTHLGKSTVDLSCGRTSAAPCHYLFLSSLCQERFLADGTKERTCRYAPATPPLQILPGERKTVTGLPGDFIYTMKLGKAPTADECLRNPIPH